MAAFLKAEKLLVVLALDPNLFQSFAPLNEKLFCPKDFFNSGWFKSCLELRNSLAYLSEILVNRPCRYSGEGESQRSLNYRFREICLCSKESFKVDGISKQPLYNF